MTSQDWQDLVAWAATAPVQPHVSQQPTTVNWSAFGVCPTCHAASGAPCSTPKGTVKKNCHDTRPFDLR